MEFRVHQKLRKTIQDEQRDIALITAPGMGLSTLLKSIPDTHEVRRVYINVRKLENLWETEFKSRSHNKRFVIHSATISALIESNLVQSELTAEAIYHTNLRSFLNENQNCFANVEKTFVVIDNFDKLPNELEKIILDELKTIADSKGTDEEYRSLNMLRFIIGGCIDFNSLYSESITGISPATNFCKQYPNQFLLTSDEIGDYLKQSYPEIIKMPEITEMIEEWSSGYLFYIEELTKWVVIQMEEDPRASFEILISRLRTVIEENDVIPIFKYCFAAWNLIKANKQLLDILYRAAKIGMVIDASQNANQLMKMGLLLEFDPRSQPDLYRIPNKIIEMFIRQRFAELGMLLPIRESMIWGVEKQNLRAYSILLDIENHLRNYIGDTLFGANKTKWIKSLDIKSDDGSNILGKLEKRKKEDIESIYSTSGTSDPLLSYLDFGDLATFIETHKANFPKEFSDKAPNFLKELNYHRRRIAHSRPMTIEQIKSVEITWKQIQKMMAKKG